MITLFSWPTPNGQKVQILLEELGEPYEARPVNILRGEQFGPEFTAVSANQKIPAIVDRTSSGETVSLFETGAILLYLADNHDRFIPTDRVRRAEVLSWLFFQCSSLAPMLGQATHFRRYAKQSVPYAIERYTREAARLYAVVETRLRSRDWLAGGEYGIVDMATFPWLCRWRRQGQDIELYPAIKAWIARISERPAVQRGMDLLKDAARETPLDEQAHDTLFTLGAPS